ncbi:MULTISPECIES: TetR/AcrR family transcriptional regulator [Streptomyces]|uniref:TetR/AcrR family transcriptional regulator n=1 Tax=Streptomyces TaxID=1883 RepID=UPI0006EBCD93|nr:MULTISPECIES: TetR/AcrR family transcriptional regulator [Streptomyces]
MATDSTRAALLDAAERLFLDHGYEKVSVRAVNAAAGRNPAAVHYHFGTKEDLVAALLQNRLGPLWAEPLAAVERRLDEGVTVDVDELVAVLVRPLDALTEEPRGRLLVHLLARVVLRRRELPFDDRWFGYAPWRRLLGAARPDLSRQEVAHRWRMAFDLLLQLYGEPQTAAADLGRTPRPSTESVTSFIAAGLNARPPNDR